MAEPDAFDAPAPPARPAHSRASLARRLRLQQLMLFEQVRASGSLLAAAGELAMTQPAISKSLHELESQVGGPLFVRGKRGVVLTELGRRFEPHAASMLAELRQLAETLNATQAGTRGQVVVGTLISASAALLPAAIERLRRDAPDVVVTVRVGPNTLLFPLLARGELDVVVGALPGATAVAGAERARLASQPLYEEALRVVVGAQHPLARRRKLALAELMGLDWIVPTPDSMAWPSVRAFFGATGLPARRIESVSILTNLALLASSPMVALMPQAAAERFAHLGQVTVLPIRGLGAFGAVGYTVRADRAPSAATERFLAALRAAGEPLGRGR
ncbi:LysR substrate-binding domain-containing protein [Ottowia sp.]|uniref:LysR substrate-binding domain-containing protein n=1 Tax=Ottowia sp. TaxID=1898956 RepID=UPI002CF7DF87|nr:LysR substrate-binding domain-containing protein [Ottowia sp.]